MVRGERARRRTGVKPCMISLLRALDLARNVWEVPKRTGRNVLLVGDEKTGCEEIFVDFVFPPGAMTITLRYCSELQRLSSVRM